MLSEKEVGDMAATVMAMMGARAGRKLRRLVAVQEGAPEKLTALQRDVLYGRIRDLANMYWLKWLVRQETAHVLGVVECLSDSELGGLLSKLERAREARIDGVPFDEVPGLVRSATTWEGEA